jgi:hypothetical protein
MVADPPLTESSKSWWKGCPSFAASWPLLPNRLHSTAEDEPHVAVSTTRSEDGAESTALVRQTHAVLGTACESVPPGGMAKAQNSGGAPSIPLADLGVTSRVRALVGGSPRRQPPSSVDCEDTDRRADKFDNRKPHLQKDRVSGTIVSSAVAWCHRGALHLGHAFSSQSDSFHRGSSSHRARGLTRRWAFGL